MLMKVEATSVRRKYNQKWKINTRVTPPPFICFHLFSASAKEGRRGRKRKEGEENNRRMNVISCVLFFFFFFYGERMNTRGIKSRFPCVTSRMKVTIHTIFLLLPKEKEIWTATGILPVWKYIYALGDTFSFSLLSICSLFFLVSLHSSFSVGISRSSSFPLNTSFVTCLTFVFTYIPLFFFSSLYLFITFTKYSFLFS